LNLGFERKHIFSKFQDFLDSPRPPKCEDFATWFYSTSEKNPVKISFGDIFEKKLIIYCLKVFTHIYSRNIYKIITEAVYRSNE